MKQVNRYLRKYYKEYRDKAKLFTDYVFGYITPCLGSYIYSICGGLDTARELDIECLIADLHKYFKDAEDRVGIASENYLTKVLTTKSITLVRKYKRSADKRAEKLTRLKDQMHEDLSMKEYKEAKRKETEQLVRDEKTDTLYYLSDSQIKILRYLIAGFTFEEVQEAMGMDSDTFRTIKNRIFAKLEVNQYRTGISKAV